VQAFGREEDADRRYKQTDDQACDRPSYADQPE